MRILPGDMNAVARALLLAAPSEREPLCAAIFQAARMAETYAARFNHLHPQWGDGSLNAAARRYPLAPEPQLDDPSYIICQQLVLQAMGRGDDHATQGMQQSKELLGASQ
ncbi:DUF7742 family protein [Tritonibacter aquimaris]|uniref:DUF7742 family protein n=1 Tax=Tritonibacter aquimaris TaxID=2663379 RepID=UPI00188612ED|nr:hypothetical protein [Tritonibacter aquimaris]